VEKFGRARRVTGNVIRHIRFASRPLYPPHYALGTRLGCIALGPDALKKTRLLPQPRIEPQFLDPPAHRRGYYTDDSDTTAAN
jgi:hypothetical protein